jgi:hypothetical protein
MQCNIIDKDLTATKRLRQVSRVAFSLHFASKKAYIQHYKMLSKRVEKVVWEPMYSRHSHCLNKPRETAKTARA